MIPPLQDPCWGAVLQGSSPVEGLSQSTRVLLTQLRRQVQATPDSLPTAIAMLHEYISGSMAAFGDLQSLHRPPA